MPTPSDKSRLDDIAMLVTAAKKGLNNVRNATAAISLRLVGEHGLEADNYSNYVCECLEDALVQVCGGNPYMQGSAPANRTIDEYPRHY